MRQHLMLSTAAVGLMLASGIAYAQAPGERRDEPRRTEEPAKGAGPQRGGAQERVQERVQDRVQGAQERVQGAGREEKGGGPARQDANDDKRQPANSAERSQPKQKDQAQESREPSRDRNREAESAKPGRDSKSSAETKQDKSAPQKSTAESEKSKTGPAAEQNQPPRNAAEQQPAQQNNRPATATDTNRTAPTNNAQTAPSGTQTNTQVNQQAQVTSEKQVRISETVSRARLAQPERNLNISIRIGETIPPRVRLYRVPPEIVSIEPEYRDYEYFATDDEVVIVEPRTHRIVSQVPRDPARARAQMGGSASPSMAAAGASPVNCQIMRRDASGNVAQAEPTTVGSTARGDTMSVIVQMPGGGSSAPIALGAPAGNIVVATQGQGDCTVTLEPQTR